MKSKNVTDFINAQLSQWPLARDNFRALRKVTVKKFNVGGLEVTVQFNPARIASSAANTSPEHVKTRPCPLCPENRPKEQIALRYDGHRGKRYDILLNPYPIFNDHIVIALATHSEQSIWKRFVDLLDLSRSCPKFIFFYNGPKCGASAPDHHHFQAIGRGKLPLENDIDKLLNSLGGVVSDPSASRSLEWLTSENEAELFNYHKFTRGIFVIRGRTVKSVSRLFYRLLDCAPLVEDEREPRFNLYTYYKSGEYRCIVIFRTVHRSHHYFAEGEEHLTVSLGCVDMAGCPIVPVQKDFEKLSPELLEEVLAEVSLTEETENLVKNRLTRTQKKVSVGIMSAHEIEFEVFSDGAGLRKAVWQDGRIEYGGALYDELYFDAKPSTTMFADATFVLHGVVIGKGFHWERTENQRFAGALKIIVENGELTAINVVGVEDYLLSVISSEMSANASLEFLKAHAVISRSWLTAMMEGGSNTVADAQSDSNIVNNAQSGPETRIIRWYGRSQHENYDVCADDHCQRYQGVRRAVGKNVRAAIDATWGEVLKYQGEICDARFSKCCGGVMEKFSTCWEDRDLPYLQPLPDTEMPFDGDGVAESQSPQTAETDKNDNAINGSCKTPAPRPLCDTSNRKILSQVLNDYDRETTDFYRWTVTQSREGISALIAKNSGIDIGTLIALEPLESGPSGRVSLLRIRGDKTSLVVGKELEIRRILSTTHLKSSAFTTEYVDSEGRQMNPSDNWTQLVLHGKGWGHGVGLCQIGAAVMASKGYDYRAILAHYYPGTEIEAALCEIVDNPFEKTAGN